MCNETERGVHDQPLTFQTVITLTVRFNPHLNGITKSIVFITFLIWKLQTKTRF